MTIIRTPRPRGEEAARGGFRPQHSGYRPQVVGGGKKPGKGGRGVGVRAHA